MLALRLNARPRALQVRLFKEEAPPAPAGQPPVAVDTEFERRIVADARRASSTSGFEEPSAASQALQAMVQVVPRAALTAR